MLHNTKLQLRAACLHSLAGGDSVPTVIRLNLDSVGDDSTVVYRSWCKMTVLDDWGVSVFVNLSKQQGESNVMTGLDHSVQTLNMSLNEVLEVDTVILRWIAQYLFISASNTVWEDLLLFIQYCPYLTFSGLELDETSVICGSQTLTLTLLLTHLHTSGQLCSTEPGHHISSPALLWRCWATTEPSITTMSPPP